MRLATEAQEAHLRAMGSAVHLIVVGGTHALLAGAIERIRELEARWTRFDGASELRRISAHAGDPVMVSDETYAVVERAVDAWGVTDGRFDPTVCNALVDAGYDRSFDEVRDFAGAAPAARPAPGCGGITLDPITRAITVPPGVALDLGGIGKGHAADVVVSELLAAGASGACANVGGDLRVEGEAPDPRGWIVGIEAHPDTCLGLASGGIATSSRSRRRWSRDGRPMHHLIDPQSGRPTAHELLAVTVLAKDASTAEVFTKAAFVAGPAAALAMIEAVGLAALLTTDDGNVVRVGGIEEYWR